MRRRAASRSSAAMSWPGMQKPHCTAPCRGTPAGGGASAPVAAPGPRPSSPRAPSASTARTRQESTMRPSSRTVQAPHSPTRQHSLVPVSSRSSRSTSSRVWCGGHLERPAAPVDGQLDGQAVASCRRALAPAAPWRSQRPPARTRSIASRYSGLGAHGARRRAGRREERSRIAARSASDAAGSARTPLSSTTSSGRGPTLP